MTGEVPRSTGAQKAETGDIEDQALLQRLRAGEDAAFGELFSRHSTAVFRLALGLVNERAEAEDLKAEAFFRVLQAIRRGSGPVDNVRGYLLIVTRRVAWEWSLRRRDVPVSDEELTHRAPSDPDTTGQVTERSLIRRAFTSLPERWRRVLWKMEVEGERPAVVATNFGLSPNATAALARRARQGLRAAYLQAHLAADRSATGCRSVLEKLGAYTAGSTSGIERRRIRAHLSGCDSCAAMHTELREVCSELRVHAGVSMAPAVIAGAAVAGGFASTVKGLLAGTKIKIALTAGSVAAVGALGMVVGPWGGGGATTPLDLAGRPGPGAQAPARPTQPPPSSSLRVTTGRLTTQARVPERTEPVAAPAQKVTSTSAAKAKAEPAGGARAAEPLATEQQAFDESAPIVHRETRVDRRTKTYENYVVVYETTTITETNSLNQTRTRTTTSSYTEPRDPAGGTPTPRTAES